MSQFFTIGLGTHLFVKVLGPGYSEGSFLVFELSCHLLLPFQPLKRSSNPVKCLAQEHNKRTCRIFTLSLFYAEQRQAVKL